MEVKFYLHYKDTIWKGEMKVLSEKIDKLIVSDRLEVMDIHINIQAKILLPLFITDNSQINVQ